MKKTKVITISAFAILFLASAFSYYAFAQEKSWEGGKVEEENNVFVNQIEKMQAEIEKMVELVGGAEKYCNNKGCWSNVNGGQVLEFKGTQGNKWTSDNNAQVLTCDDGNGMIWESDNNGQVLKYTDSSNIKWTSDNTGQVLIYDDGKGNRWESDNNGQVLKYEGTQGKWESDNNGQTLEFNDGSKKWINDNEGQFVNYEDLTGNEWDQNDLIKN